MSLKVFYEILNQRDTPAMFADVFSNRPAFGFNGRIFISIDTKQIYRDYGTFWDLIADAGAGSGTLQSVCTNGNFTTTDIDMLSGNLILRSLTPGGVLFTNASEIVTQDVTNFFWDDTNNRLGIRTNTPGVAFDVHSTDQVIQQLNNTTTQDSLLSFLNQNTGKWRIGNYYNSNLNDFVIYDTVSGVTRAFFTNTGYTILPTNLIIGSSNRSSAYGMDVYVSANLQSTLRVVGGSTFLSQIGGTSAVFTGDLTIATNKLFVNSSTGNIGMGTITPEALANNTTLEIDGTNHSFVRTGTSVYGGYFATIPTADVLVLSNVRNPVNGTFSNINKACSQISLFGASGDGYIVAATSPTNNGAPVERLRITKDGNVGIGTSSPTAAAGLAFVLNSGASQGRICIKTSTTGDASGDGLQIGMSGNDAFIEQRENADLSFATNASERIRINSAGQVLIGSSTSAQGQKLEVTGGIYMTSTMIILGTNIQYGRHGSSDGVQFTAGVGGVYLDYGNTSWTSLSDERFKNIDSEILNATDSLMTLRTIKYCLKDDKRNKINLGLIAQDVVKVFPEIVDIENNEIGKMGVRYSELIPVLVKSIQELEGRIKQLENK
jgi:hypothetical protein